MRRSVFGDIMKQMATAFATPFDSEGRGAVADPVAHVSKHQPSTGS